MKGPMFVQRFYYDKLSETEKEGVNFFRIVPSSKCYGVGGV